eukprot:scaffold19927_cov65-Phaeocystis_antarctica.AAC.6
MSVNVERFDNSSSSAASPFCLDFGASLALAMASRCAAASLAFTPAEISNLLTRTPTERPAACTSA